MIVTAIVLVVVAGIYVVVATPVIGVRSVHISGGDAQLRAKVEGAVAVPSGTPMARVDVDAIAKQVLAIVPTVREVTVARSWPGTLSVRVVPRVPVVAYQQGGSAVWHLADEQGVLVRNSSSVPDGVTVVSSPESPASVASAAAVVAALPKSVRSTVASVRVPSKDSITLTTKKGQSVIWGSAEDTPRKSRVLTALLKHKARVYDVSAPDLPTTRG